MTLTRQVCNSHLFLKFKYKDHFEAARNEQ
jgi:hypothetical protein